MTPTSPLACCWLHAIGDWPFLIEPPVRDVNSSNVVDSDAIT